MKRSARTIVLVGLVVGVAASGAAALWIHKHSNTSARAWQQAADPTTRGTPKDIAALEAEVERLKANKTQFAQLASELKSDLTALRSQLAEVDRRQESTGHKLNQVADKISQAGLEGSAQAAGDEEADGALLTPEEERERAAARTQAEIELLEGTVLAEKTDPEWASAAQLALSETFQSEAIPGHLVDVECRTTLCRMELSLDGSTPQDSFRHLIDSAPWSGESLIQIDTEAGVAVMYLGREEHALPQLTE